MNLTIEVAQQADNVVLRVLPEAGQPVSGTAEYDSWGPGVAEYESWSAAYHCCGAAESDST